MANSATERVFQGCQNGCPLLGIFRKGTEKADEILGNDIWKLGAGLSRQSSHEPEHIASVLGDILRVNVLRIRLASGQVEPRTCLQGK